MRDPLSCNRFSKIFKGHSNAWESTFIAEWFALNGYEVEVIDFNDFNYTPEGSFDIMLDIAWNLSRLKSYGSKNCLRIMHITGAYPEFQNNAELERISQIANRTGVTFEPRRLVKDIDIFLDSLEIADTCSLIGNKFTLSTFPRDVRDKITLVTVSGSIPVFSKKRRRLIAENKEFIWYFGGGAIHKGLDIVIETFLKNPEWKLNIIGNIDLEEDFFSYYKDKITMSSNIRFHGYLLPNSKKFKEVVSNCVAFIAPSCSESISTAVATCLQVGLFPIISHETGVDLEGGGIYLKNCTVEEIEKAIKYVFSLPAFKLEEEIVSNQKMAKYKYSRKYFSELMGKYLSTSLGSRKNEK